MNDSKFFLYKYYNNRFTYIYKATPITLGLLKLIIDRANVYDLYFSRDVYYIDWKFNL